MREKSRIVNNSTSTESRQFAVINSVIVWLWVGLKGQHGNKNEADIFSLVIIAAL